MEAAAEESSFSKSARELDEGRYPSGNLILWFAAIAVLVGMNFASWSFCMWVFGHPEHPMNYGLLTKLEKLDPIRGFLPVTAPRGKFHSAKEIYAQVFPFSDAELAAYNGILKRHYLKNYLERDDVTFLSGEFIVESVQRMGEEDVFTSGIVVRAKSSSFPEAVLDLALPSENPPEQFALKRGDSIRVPESSTCAALLHVQREGEVEIVFTVVPLVTRTEAPSGEPTRTTREFELAEGAVIELSTPPLIQLEPRRWPISDPVEEAVEAKPVGVGAEGATVEGEEAPGEGPDQQP